MADDDDKRPLIIDTGSGSIKAGFGGEDVPRVVFPTIVSKSYFEDRDNMSTRVGHGALSIRGRLQMHCPMEFGLVSNWDEMESIWNHTFYNELRVDPEEHSILLTTKPLCPNVQKEKMAQIMFETFNVPAMYVANQSVLSLYSSGHTSGIMVDCGDAVSYSVPVFEFSDLPYASLWLDLGGRNLTEYLAEMLYSKGYSLSKFEKEQGWVLDMKEKLGYVALDYDRELESAKRRRDVYKNYELPDGQVIEMGEERFKYPEVLFQPYLMDKDADGIHEITNDSIKRCHEDVRNSLYKNIVLSGGTTLFPGFVERMRKEITSLAPRNMTIKVVATPERKYNAWIGGSILTSLTSFQKKWISHGEYDESGPTIVHRK